MKPRRKVLKVLIRVDLKNDFMPGWPMGVTGGDQTVSVANSLSRSGYYNLVVDVEDDHPAKHKSFASQHQRKSKKVFEFVNLYGVRQQLWFDHCVHDTDGARFHPDLDRSMVSRTFQKGQDPRVDSYSGFYDNGRSAAPRFRKKYPFLGRSTGLAEYIRSEARRLGADEIQVDVIGLALGYCVSYTAFDGRNEKYKGRKFKVRVVEDGVRSIVFKDGDHERYLDALRRKRIEIIHSVDVLTKVA